MQTERASWKLNVVLVAATLLMAATGAGANTKTLVPGETGRVTGIVAGDTLFLDSGLKVRLSAIQAPGLSLGHARVKKQPLADKSQTALEKLALNRTVRLYYGGLRRDRYNRALAQVYLLDAKGHRNIWLQEEIVRQGWAQVHTWPDTWQDTDQLYKAEQKARTAKRGIWSHDLYAVRSPDPNMLAQDMDSFQIVEGVVVSTADVRGRLYLNFGSDYRTDFTVVIDKRDRNRFEKNGDSLLSLEGASVRVRGWIEMNNGPAIWLDHPERLEILN
ncbi:MAG: thermonuclease family protein [Hyphomonadaceae bacterium]|nr:thermonuclease family protein [Hyphomonadaceae bacterium]MBC6412169.1 thermonuclease family protein [Hyphomonadaceae bacterium]